MKKKIQDHARFQSMKHKDRTTHPWEETEISFHSQRNEENPYTALTPWVEFIHEDSGTRLRRPMFWDGGTTWRVRFAPIHEGNWSWASSCDKEDPGLSGQNGSFVCEACETENVFRKHGFWKMSPKGRNLIHADGHPALIAADTAWALPWRSTEEQCRIYADDRKQKGFNAALLMTVQPDMDARGPRNRTEHQGFAVGFEDLPLGRLSLMNPEYFQEFDRLVSILLEHDIVPVYQPVFHGYGWKGLRPAGNVVSPQDYARYCRFLVARYGARPAVYLIGGDGDGYAPAVNYAGRAVEEWDAYGQPAGIHYQPHSQSRAQQEEKWLDFQWCQTGHAGTHNPERVADMWRNDPPKGIANGEPTYENIGSAGNGVGWWQGHEAWLNLCAGGTMGVFYGAASLWQWRLSPDEPGHADWCHSRDAGWREALDFEGSSYVGLVHKILSKYDFIDMHPACWYTSEGRCLAVDGKFFLAYLEKSGDVSIYANPGVIPPRYTVFDPKTGQALDSGNMNEGQKRIRVDDSGQPRVVVFA